MKQKTLTQHLFGAVSKAVVLDYVRSESDAAAAEPSPMCWSACSWLEHGDASQGCRSGRRSRRWRIERLEAWRKVGGRRCKHPNNDDERATS